MVNFSGARSRPVQLCILSVRQNLQCFVKEIRTPLSGIMGCMSLLDQSALTPEQHENVRISQVCGEQLLLVIDDILDLTKLEVR
jgi:signal transduction histidine kinase